LLLRHVRSDFATAHGPGPIGPDPNIHPEAEEVCDGLDNNCDGRVDERSDISWFPDGDGDGFGGTEEEVQQCDPMDGYVNARGDCDDGDPTVYPGADDPSDLTKEYVLGCGTVAGLDECVTDAFCRSCLTLPDCEMLYMVPAVIGEPPMSRSEPQLPRLLAGVRPGEQLHLGHYTGTLRECVRRQDERECFFLIADVQALTTHRKNPKALGETVRSVVLDCLAVGMKPERWSFVLQSQVPELMELTTYLEPLVHAGEILANSTIREEARSLGKGDLELGLNRIDMGFLSYPVYQAADVLAFSQLATDDEALEVSVRPDQLPHLELAVLVTSRFNDVYSPTFRAPRPLLSRLPPLPGTDGGFRMGKNPASTIHLSEARADFAPKLEAMYTDPTRMSPAQPGKPRECPAYLYRRALRPPEARFEPAPCANATLECLDCKRALVTVVTEFVEPIQEERRRLERTLTDLRSLISTGTRRARSVVQSTVARVRAAMSLAYPELLSQEGRP